LGLFTSRPIRAGETIVEFKGEWIDQRQYRIRVEKGQGGYMIDLGKGIYLDCFPFKDTCKASMANSVENAYDKSTQQRAVRNAYLDKNKHSKRVFLKSTRDIPAHGEILYNYWYNSSSDYPDVLLHDDEMKLSDGTPETSEESTSDDDYINS